MDIVQIYFGDSSSGLGALGVNGSAFVIQLITFILAYLVLRKYAFGPILKVLKVRRDTIEQGVKLGEKMQKDQLDLAQKVDQTLHAARQQADDIIGDAQDTARQTIRQAEDKARQKAILVLAAADDQIKLDTAQARQQLEKELVGLISDATEAIIEEKVDSKKDVQLIERALQGRQAV